MIEGAPVAPFFCAPEPADAVALLWASGILLSLLKGPCCEDDNKGTYIMTISIIVLFVLAVIVDMACSD